MKTIWLAILALALPCEHAFAWGQEGHSIVAELAEHRLDQPTLEKIRLLLKTEISGATQDTRVSLGSVASWADDYRAEHEETRNWHFVNIPLERGTYDPQIDCKPDPKSGDCIINAIERNRSILAGAADLVEVLQSACTKQRPDLTRLMAFRNLGGRDRGGNILSCVQFMKARSGMTNINRRAALGACLTLGGIALMSTKAASQSEPTKTGPVNMEQWLELAESAKSIDSPLYTGRFREPMYFLLEPISWTPRFTEARKLSNVTVPKGFVTDLASIPPMFYSFLRPDGEYAYAAIIHDYLYWEQNVSIDTANSTLKAAMQDLSVDPFKVEAIHSAVSWGGQKYWDQNKKLKEQGERRYLQEFPPTAAVSWEDWKKRPGVFRP